MNLTTQCSSCKAPIKIKSNAQTRPDLQMEKGNEFTVNCNACGKIDKKHVNDISAEPNKIILLFGIIAGVIATVFLWTFYGAIGTVSIIIPLLFWQQQTASTKSFNSYMIRRK